MEDGRAMNHLLLDIVFMETVGMRPVLVHGGGAAISRAMTEAGLQPRFVQGRRYTDEATWRSSSGCWPAKSTNGSPGRSRSSAARPAAEFPNHQRALRRAHLPARRKTAQPVDLGYVGAVTRVDRATIERPMPCGHRAGHPLDVHRPTNGQKLNVNADTAATAVAQAVRPRNWCT